MLLFFQSACKAYCCLRTVAKGSRPSMESTLADTYSGGIGYGPRGSRPIADACRPKTERPRGDGSPWGRVFFRDASMTPATYFAPVLGCYDQRLVEESSRVAIVSKPNGTATIDEFWRCNMIAKKRRASDVSSTALPVVSVLNRRR